MITIFATSLIEHIYSYDAVLVPMGINNSFNSGIREEIAVNFPFVRERENEFGRYGDKRKYGSVLIVESDGIAFCLCYVCDGGYNKRNFSEKVRYDDIESCLSRVKERFPGKKIASPILCHDAVDGGGDKERILGIFKSVFTDSDIDIYDYEQKDFGHECFKRIAELREMLKTKEITNEEYVKERSVIEWKRRNGIFKEMPEDYTYKPKDIDRGKQIILSGKNLRKK